MKNAILIIVGVWFGFPTTGQITFNHQFDFTEFPFHVLTSVLPTDSCFYATGVITDTTNQSFAVGNIFIKFDLMGEVVFYKKLSDPQKYYETWLGDLEQTVDGKLVDTGTTTDSTTNIVIIKYDISGDTLFTKEIKNPLAPHTALIYTAGLVVMEGGDMYILARIDANDLNNEEDLYLFHTDQMGNVLDTFVYGTTLADVPFSMIRSADGGMIIGSKITNQADVWQNFISRVNIFQVDSLGSVKWEYTSPANQLFDSAKGMVYTSDGGLVVATGKGIEHQVNPSFGQLRWNGYIFKLGANHQKEWGVELRGTRPSASTGFTKVVEATDGSGYVATGNLGEDVSIGEEVFGSWLVKVSTQGDSLWARYYSYFDGIDSQPYPKDFKATPDGGYVIVGETKPYFPDGQGQRAWIMKLDEQGCLIPGCEENDTVISSIDLPVEKPFKLAIHPNPTSYYLNFQLRTHQPVTSASFRIIDLHGRVVQEIESSMPKETHVVPVYSWAAGGYFLQYMKGGRVIHSERFIIK